MADRGRVRKERIVMGAFDYSINDPDARIDLLVGHDFGKPIASRQTATLDIRNEGDSHKFLKHCYPMTRHRGLWIWKNP